MGNRMCICVVDPWAAGRSILQAVSEKLSNTARSSSSSLMAAPHRVLHGLEAGT